MILIINDLFFKYVGIIPLRKWNYFVSMSTLFSQNISLASQALSLLACLASIILYPFFRCTESHQLSRCGICLRGLPLEFLEAIRSLDYRNLHE